MEITRRRLLKMGLTAGAGLALPLGTLAVPLARLGAASSVTSPNVEPFAVPLPVPSVLKPTHTDANSYHYEVTQKPAEQEILPGMKTEIWGYDGVFPGPTIEARRDRTVVVRHTNELPVPVVVHLHGGKTPPEHDGYPTDFVLPKGGGSSTHSMQGHGGHEPMGMVGGAEADRNARVYEYPNGQPAATLWYHDHRMDFTGPQVYKGLAGLYLIRDEVEDSLPLPRGDKEVPLVICDRTFGEDGSLYYPSADPSLMGEPGTLANAINGFFGDTILVNGAPWPVVEVSNTMHRLRVLNASNARFYELTLDPPPPGGKPFVQIGSDGGLLEAPVLHDSVLVSPAERFDMVVDFSRYPVGAEVTVRNLEGEGRTRDVMRFVVARKEKEEGAVPARLAPDPDFSDPKGSEATRRFQFVAGGSWGGMSTVNFRVFDPERVDASPRLGSTEVWEFHTDQDHPIHLHLVHFRVISRNGGPPGPHDAGWKDTVAMRAGEDVRVAVRFSGYRGRYVFHCHNLEHEDMMMMANFEVV
jgi:spore coat protein A